MATLRLVGLNSFSREFIPYYTNKTLEMEKEALLKTAPLMSGKLKDQREQIRENIILSIIDEHFSDSTFTAERIHFRMRSELGIDIESASITQVLEENESFSRILAGNSEYEVSGSIPVETYDSKIDSLWLEFSSDFDDASRDFDPYALDSNVKDAFYEFFGRLFDYIQNSNEQIESASRDPIYDYDTEEMLNDVIKEHDLNNPALFKETLSEYLESPSDDLKEFAGSVYQGLINWDLMQREENLEPDQLELHGNKLFLDTNVLVALLCQTDRRNPIVSELVDLSNDVGFDMHYMTNTQGELERLIGGSRAEMDELGQNPNSESAISSQFVKDWFRQRAATTWSEYKAEMANWESILAMQDIDLYSNTIDYDENLESMVDSWITTLDKSSGNGRSRDVDSVNHDKGLITKAASLRPNVDETRGPASPIIITLDNLLSSIDEMGKGEIWDEHMIVLAREWLNYLLSFSAVSGGDSDSDQIGSIILQSTINFSNDAKIDSVDEYVDLLAPKAHLEQSESDVLKEYITTIGLNEEIEKALDQGRSRDAENIVKNALTNEEYLEVFKEKSEEEEKLKQASESANEFRKLYEREKERRKQAEKMFAEVSGASISIDARAISESTSKSEAHSISHDLENFIELLDSSLDGGLEKSDAPEAPKEFSNLDQVKNWLDETNTWLSTASGISSGAQALAPLADQLLTQILG